MLPPIPNSPKLSQKAGAIGRYVIKEVWQAVEATRTITETPAGAAILHLFDALKEALKGQTRLAEINSTQAALMCKHVLSELTKGRLDYKPSSVKQ